MSEKAKPCFEKPVSSRLARRLAAAADGYRTGKKIWLRARYKAVDGSFKLQDPIVSDKQPSVDLKEGEGLFGPFLSDREPKDLKQTPIVSIRITVKHPDRNEEVYDLPANEYDALFWSISALEKFAIPHYVAFEGLEEATHLKTKFQQPKSYLMVHGPNTEYTIKEIADSRSDQTAWLIEI